MPKLGFLTFGSCWLSDEQTRINFLKVMTTQEVTLAFDNSFKSVFLNLGLGFKSWLTTKFLYYCPGHNF